MFKQILFLIIIFSAVNFGFNNTAVTYASWLIPASECANPSPLYDKYPCIGGSETSMYFLDPSSCYAHTDGNVATLSAMFYATGGGAAPGGGPGKLTPYTAIFKTYTKNGKRKIILDSVKDRYGEDINFFSYRDNKKFFDGLFWMIASETGMSAYLD